MSLNSDTCRPQAGLLLCLQTLPGLCILRPGALGSSFPNATSSVRSWASHPSSVYLHVLVSRMKGVEVILSEMVWLLSLTAKQSDGKNSGGSCRLQVFWKIPLGWNTGTSSLVDMCWYYEMILFVLSWIKIFRCSKPPLCLMLCSWCLKQINIIKCCCLKATIKKTVKSLLGLTVLENSTILRNFVFKLYSFSSFLHNSIYIFSCSEMMELHWTLDIKEVFFVGHIETLLTPAILNERWLQISLCQYQRILCVFTIDPHPVSDLCVAFVGVTQVTLTWRNGNDTATCRMLLELTGSPKEMTQDLAVNISDLKPGIQYKVTLYFPESNEAQRDLLVTESSLGELQKCASLPPCGFNFQ